MKLGVYSTRTGVARRVCSSADGGDADDGGVAASRPSTPTQNGYRGTGMDQLVNPRGRARAETRQCAARPDRQGLARRQAREEVYKNVQVLGDLSEDQFNRVMLALAAWVAPQDGDKRLRLLPQHRQHGRRRRSTPRKSRGACSR